MNLTIIYLPIDQSVLLSKLFNDSSFKFPEKLELLTIEKDYNDPRWGFSCYGRKDYEYPIQIDYVRKGGPADRAGLQHNDLMWTINGKYLGDTTNRECWQEVRRSGTTLIVGVERSAKMKI